MKFIDDLFKDDAGRWKAEKMWTNVAIGLFHGLAFYQRDSLDIMDYVYSVGILHGALFTTNGLKTFLEKKVPSINIDSKETNVTQPPFNKTEV